MLTGTGDPAADHVAEIAAVEALGNDHCLATDALEFVCAENEKDRAHIAK
jgi:hypothetical protein